MVDPAEAFANSLGMHVDATNVRGKCLFQQVTNSTSIIEICALTPSMLGARCNACAQIFARWRFKRCILKLNYTGSGSSAWAVLDDYTGEGDQPTNINALLELRTSATNFSNDPPTVLDYRPPTSEWYYTFAGASGSDPRLVNAGALFAVQPFSTSNAVFSVEIDFSIVFKGAVDTGSSVSIPRLPADWHTVESPPGPGKELPVRQLPASHSRGLSLLSR